MSLPLVALSAPVWGADSACANAGAEMPAQTAAPASKTVLIFIAKPPFGCVTHLREHQMYIQVNKNLR
jgi:hypothetical protein